MDLPAWEEHQRAIDPTAAKETAPTRSPAGRDFSRRQDVAVADNPAHRPLERVFATAIALPNPRLAAGRAGAGSEAWAIAESEDADGLGWRSTGTQVPVSGLNQPLAPEL
jgi:hypothetical protein